VSGFGLVGSTIIGWKKDNNCVSLLTKRPERMTYHHSKTGVYANVWRHSGKLYKFIWFKDERPAELYELYSDPQERSNLAASEQIVAQSMQQKLFEYFHLER